MGKRVFVAGGTGVIGNRLLPLLAGAGYSVSALARTPESAHLIEQLGGEPCLADAFDGRALAKAVADASPEVVINQLSDLSHGFEADRIAETLRRNARMRTQGTSNLLRAAQAAGAGRFIAQSIAFIYAPGNLPHEESDPLVEGKGPMAEVIHATRSLEEQVIAAYPTSGVILRYGKLYGPGTGADAPHTANAVHADAAAFAALLAIDHGNGIYNVADDEAEVSSLKAKQELGWKPSFRERLH